MTFEKACEKDIASLAEMRLLYLAEDHGVIPPEKLGIISDGLPDYFRRHLDCDLFAFVCRDGDVIAGCCFLYVSERPPSPSFMTGKTGSVLNVYTRPSFRRQGIAGRLMKMLLSESERLGLDFVELKATDDGYNLYKSLGFEDTVSKYHDMKFIIDGRIRD
ncbi:Ribosomal protein S18 acetylase RimI [Ruminococcaceae bacterium FB2012]|nr:Ribosomal protein S18 acetylase RimI [Ruminococcaceae bacterium FB2012]